jgi:hypothetical protein
VSDYNGSTEFCKTVCKVDSSIHYFFEVTDYILQLKPKFKDIYLVQLAAASAPPLVYNKKRVRCIRNRGSNIPFKICVVSAAVCHEPSTFADVVAVELTAVKFGCRHLQDVGCLFDASVVRLPADFEEVVCAHVPPRFTEGIRNCLSYGVSHGGTRGARIGLQMLHCYAGDAGRAGVLQELVFGAYDFRVLQLLWGASLQQWALPLPRWVHAAHTAELVGMMRHVLAGSVPPDEMQAVEPFSTKRVLKKSSDSGASIFTPERAAVACSKPVHRADTIYLDGDVGWTHASLKHAVLLGRERIFCYTGGADGGKLRDSPRVQAVQQLVRRFEAELWLV